VCVIQMRRAANMAAASCSSEVGLGLAGHALHLCKKEHTRGRNEQGCSGQGQSLRLVQLSSKTSTYPLCCARAQDSCRPVCCSECLCDLPRCVCGSFGRDVCGWLQGLPQPEDSCSSGYIFIQHVLDFEFILAACLRGRTRILPGMEDVREHSLHEARGLMIS